jgi:hypothetical protein
MKEIDKHIEQIVKLCNINKVQSLFAFGSVTTDHLRTDSDIDLVVAFDDPDPLSYADKYFNLKYQLEKLFNRPIDLLEEKAIRNRFLRQQIDQTKILVYGDRN